MWDVIRGLVREGTTLLLTTQYLEEADELADTIAVVDHGRIIARGTADELKSQVGGERIEVVVHDRADIARASARSCSATAGGDGHARRAHPQADRAGQRRRAGRWSRSCATSTRPAIGIDDIGLRRPTLDDVFLALTGHAAELRMPTRPRTARARRSHDAPHAPRPAPPAADRQVRQAVATASSSCWRNLKRIPRIPELAIFAIIQSIMFVLLFAFVFGGAIPLPGYADPNAYREYLMPGIFAQTIVFAAATTAIGMCDDINKGIIDRFRSLPMARSAVLTGRTLSDVVYNGGILHRPDAVGPGRRLDASTPASSRFLAGVGLLLLFAFAMSWIGVWLGLSVPTVEVAQQVVVHGHLPAHVRLERVRADRDAADLAAADRGVEPDRAR